MKNLLTRTLTGILFIVIITTAVLSGAYTFLFIFGIISLLGYIEFINLTQFGRKFDKILLMLDMAGACALFLAVFSFSGQLPYNFQKASILTYVIYLIARPVTQLYSTPEKSPITSWAYSILGQIYVVLPLALLGVWGYKSDYQLFMNTEYLLMALFVFVWTNDTGAYIVGCTLGKHRLFERISPKKSWEGFFGGLAFCFFGKLHHTGYAFDSPMDRYGNLNLHIFHLGRSMRVLTQTYGRSKRFRENIAGTRGYSRSLRQRVDSLARYIHISDFRFITPMLASASFLH